VRHKLNSILPIFLIAILVQVFAPIGASLTMAAASDPLSAAPICTHETSSTDRPDTPAENNNDDACCPLCGFAHTGFAPLAAPDFVIGRRPAPIVHVAWHVETKIPPRLWTGFHARSRAPPLFS
jgi:hypothetical protein